MRLHILFVGFDGNVKMRKKKRKIVYFCRTISLVIIILRRVWTRRVSPLIATSAAAVSYDLLITYAR